MPRYVEGVELTQEGMDAIFTRMGHSNISSGMIYDGQPIIAQEALDNQGFMPVLAGVGSRSDSGHWLMLIKGPGKQYYLFDPLGKTSGENYQHILADQLPEDSNLSVIPNGPDLNKGLCGYWVASVGLRAHAQLNTDSSPDLVNLGQTITNEMRNELEHDGYRIITDWLRAVADEFPEGDPQPDARALREFTQKALGINIPPPVPPMKDLTPKELPVESNCFQLPYVPVWNGFSLYTDDIVRAAAQYAYDNYLGKPYTGTVESVPANFGGQMVYRQHHGLSHTLRTMAYAELIVEEARKAKLRGETLRKFKDGRTIADVTPEELKKIMIAQAFFVAGRDDEASDAENYRKYHEQSRDAFLKYVKDNEPTLIPDVFKDEEDVNLYAQVIEDKNHDWSSSPAIVLINQAHMVDLVRVKQPPESYLENYFKSMLPWIGPQATEAVFAIQRQFFHATHEVVAGFDSDNKEPHLVVAGLRRYVIGEDGQPMREAPKEGQREGDLKAFPQAYKLKETERFMRVDEFLKLPEVQSTFPGAGKHLQGGMPGMNEMDYWNRLNSVNRARCENDVDFCLKQLEIAHHKAKIDPIKVAVQPSEKITRREPNIDEIAAAGIIREILANPDSIQNDHVLINGQKLEEQFFRDLLAKCDMAIVGSLLNDKDISNIDKLMEYEKNTEFHETGEEPVACRAIGKEWLENYRLDRYNQRRTPEHSIKMALIHMMQDGSWYYRRLNAVAQGRDTGSSFKEVLISALMVPSTFKALSDIQEPEFGKKISQTHPTKIHKGLMSLPPDITQKILNQSEAIIANTTMGLFSDPSAKTYQQMKINQFSHLLARTCSSTTIDEDVGTFFTNGRDNNIRLDIEDPDGLLNAKRVGGIGVGGENEYSVYLPDDVALIPIAVNKGNPNVISLVAVKSPDFIPRHESGYAVEPFLRMQTAKLAEIKSSVENNQVEPIIELQSDLSLVEETDLPSAYKNFIKNTVGPVLENFLNGFMEKDAVALSKALAAFPPDGQWSAFNSEVAGHAKRQMDALKQMVPNIVVLNTLAQCQDALEKQNIAGALEAFKNIPSEKEMGTISRELRGQIQRVRQDLESLQRAVVTPVVTDEKKVKERYDALIEGTSKKITELEKATLDELDVIKKAISNLGNLRQEVTLLHNEKVRMHSKTDTIDFSDIEKLEQQIQVMDTKLADAYLLAVTRQISALESIPKNQSELKAKIATFFDTITEIDMLRNERIKKYGASKDPLDLSDLDKLSGNLQGVNQSLVSNLIKTIRSSCIQMKSNTFQMQKEAIEENIELLEKLEKSMDKSETAEKLRKDIPKLKDLLIAQQKAYPKMTQLIEQLRELCQTHHDDLNKKRTARLQELDRQAAEGGITGIVGNIFFGVTNMIGLTKDEQLEIKMKQQSLARFKADLFDEKNDIDALLVKLAYKSPSDLQEGLGISENNAKELCLLIKNLAEKTYSANELEEKLKAIDEISPKLARECESLKFEAIDNDESTGNTMRF
ncbi:TPA: SidE phosphodiesterase domain-containing protein [Legionella pneumophila]|uniref:SidE phosphodiesterase domain-containing protein n=3 Tax=Legionella pneumophila TaxID=446 RepID=UPI00058D5240|nr:SidE phosphodiesterase domain-containing protein [Legionella pneumophila]HAT9274215.1 NAD-dependent ubiquitin ligase [Legionella pneumophila subsp. pneumophila]MCO1452075.1 SidE phosphodiesterase domain-containing protein [Legionella pneumophila]MCW8458096.1 SidE phosphodiesterase domain-containing protein [Legionella pneumophila]MCZ4729305.1 SidE phosphodiesterase domain-containing protein [Legionella pneumophila]MDI0457592.1 SidE phosphodiesterase domain-containing protein [Legionella pne